MAALKRRMRSRLVGGEVMNAFELLPGFLQKP